MVGERNQNREAVRWEPGDTTTSSSQLLTNQNNDNILSQQSQQEQQQQQQQQPYQHQHYPLQHQSSFDAMCSGGQFGDSMAPIGFGGYDGALVSTTNMGAPPTAEGGGVGGTGDPKEVRYVQFPPLQSPSHLSSTNLQSRELAQAPLQRTHSRYLFFRYFVFSLDTITYLPHCKPLTLFGLAVMNNHNFH